MRRGLRLKARLKTAGVQERVITEGIGSSRLRGQANHQAAMRFGRGVLGTSEWLLRRSTGNTGSISKTSGPPTFKIAPRSVHALGGGTARNDVRPAAKRAYPPAGTSEIPSIWKDGSLTPFT